jgi:hypothetical protein
LDLRGRKWREAREDCITRRMEKACRKQGEIGNAYKISTTEKLEDLRGWIFEK